MYFPFEYRERMMAEQMIMIEAFQFVVQILIYIFILLSLVSLIVNLSEIVRTRLRARGPSENRQPRLDQRIGEAMRQLIGENRR